MPGATWPSGSPCRTGEEEDKQESRRGRWVGGRKRGLGYKGWELVSHLKTFFLELKFEKKKPTQIIKTGFKL
jgi:hypothetical protein